MEIRYQRMVTYSIDLTDKGEKDLAKHLGITRAKMIKLVDNGDLMDDHRDAILNWVLDNEHLAQVSSHEDIEDLEID